METGKNTECLVLLPMQKMLEVKQNDLHKTNVYKYGASYT